MKANFLSSVVGTQLPEFQKESYPLFQTLLEAYYDFNTLHKNTLQVSKNLIETRTIDGGASDFIDFFSSEYLAKFPKNIAANKNIAIKHILDLYRTKGSPKSIAIFFRLVYNADAKVRYPGEQILIASGSKWKQQSSIRLNILSGVDQFTTNEQILTWSNISGHFKVSVSEIKHLSGTVYELFFSRKQTVTINVGDVVTCANTNVTFSGGALPCVSDVSILSGGMGFKVGQVFRLSGSGGETVFRVTKIGDNGELLKTEMVGFLYGSVVSQLYTIDNASTYGTPVSAGTNTGVVISDPYFSDDYFSDDYLVADTVVISGPLALIQTVGAAITTYPGYHSTSNAEISNPTIRVQDNYYYQNFSYVIDSNVSAQLYKKSVKDLIHPAGYAMFANYDWSDNIDLSANLDESIARITRIYLQDSLSATDQFKLVNASFKFTDSVTASDTIYHADGYAVDGYMSDYSQPTTTDGFQVTVLETKSDSVSASDALFKHDPYTIPGYAATGYSVDNVTPIVAV